MGTSPGVIAARVILLGALVTGWLVGLIGQRSIVESTDYLDVSPPLLLLGVGLCLVAGVAVRAMAPGRRKVRLGAFGGLAMLASILIGYAALAIAYRDRFDPAESGETWVSLVLESWFWIGVPVVVGAGLGALGWLAADAVAGLARSHPRSASGRPG